MGYFISLLIHVGLLHYSIIISKSVIGTYCYSYIIIFLQLLKTKITSTFKPQLTDQKVSNNFLMIKKFLIVSFLLILICCSCLLNNIYNFLILYFRFPHTSPEMRDPWIFIPAFQQGCFFYILNNNYAVFDININNKQCIVLTI